MRDGPIIIDVRPKRPNPYVGFWKALLFACVFGLALYGAIWVVLR